MDFNDHKLIEEREIIEKYILGELPPEMEEAFEEHLLYCKECRDNYNNMRDIISGAQKALEKNVFEGKRKAERQSRHISINLLKLAAGFVIVIGLAFSIYYMVKTKGPEPVNLSCADTLTKSATSFDTLTKNTDSTIENKESTKTIPAQLYADAYKPLSYLEGAIDNQLRSESLKIISPKPSAEFHEPYVILFDWEPVRNESLSLVIKDNKGETIFESEISAPFTYMRSLHQGLYYWQLNTKDETLYAGKFFLR